MSSSRTPQMQYSQFRVFRGFKAPRIHSVARYGDRPRSNVFRGLTVRIVLVAALLAAEVQALPVRCRDVAAGAAPTACITWTDRLQFDSDSSGFVCNLESHVSIRPAVNFGSEVFPFTQRTVSNVLQVFDHDAPCANLNRVANQCLGCDMQEMSRYGSLTPRHPFQESPGASGANGLNSSASAPDTRATVIQHPAVEEKWFGICRVGRNQHSLDAHINTDDTAFGLGLWNINLVSQVEKPLVSDSLNLGIFPSAFRQRSVICNRQEFTPKRDAFFGAVEIPLPHHGNQGARELGQPPAPVRFCGFICGADGFANGAGELGWKT